MPQPRLITLSTLTYDPQGYVEVPLSHSTTDSLYDRSRRATVIPTLDGGAVHDDMGYSASDRKWTVRTPIVHPDMTAKLRYLHDNYSQVRASTTDGVYRVAILSYTETSEPRSTLVLHVLEKVSE